MKRYLFPAVLIFAVLLLHSCSEEPRDFTMYDPGEYKGTIDPLLAKNLDKQLDDRFMAVQTDR